MNNVLSYYYHLYPTNIHQQNKEFKFQLEGYDYVFSPLNVDAKQLEFLYQLSNQLLQYQMYVSQIVPNVHQQLFTLVHEEPYVLVRFFNRNTESVHFLDLLRFQEQTRLFALKPSSLSWKRLWEDKIDYFEYQMEQFGKSLSLARDSFSYYIGLAEMAISLLNFVDGKIQHPVISHRRITSDYTMRDLYNSLNFVIDSQVRDVADYFKCHFFKGDYILDEMDYYISTSLQGNEYLLFFARMLFPTYYFDLFEDVLFSDLEEKELINVMDKSDEYEELLVDLYYKIQEFTQLPEIDWFKFYHYTPSGS